METKEKLPLLDRKPRFDKSKIQRNDMVQITEADGYTFNGQVLYVDDTEICILEPVAEGNAKYIIEVQEYADGLFKIEIIRRAEDGE